MKLLLKNAVKNARVDGPLEFFVYTLVQCPRTTNRHHKYSPISFISCELFLNLNSGLNSFTIKKLYPGIAVDVVNQNFASQNVKQSVCLSIIFKHSLQVNSGNHLQLFLKACFRRRTLHVPNLM